jgi:hypothetical protein
MLWRLLRGLSATGTVAIITLLLLEICSRIFDPFGISYYPETARYLDTMIIEDPIGYRNRPGLQGNFWGQEVSINSLGLRDREVAHQPADNEFRIMMLGDSVVFGVGSSYPDSIPQQLEQQLNQRFRDRKYRVINMGVPSYNTEQEHIQFQTLVSISIPISWG